MSVAMARTSDAERARDQELLDAISKSGSVEKAEEADEHISTHTYA